MGRQGLHKVPMQQQQLLWLMQQLQPQSHSSRLCYMGSVWSQVRLESVGFCFTHGWGIMVAVCARVIWCAPHL